MGDSNSLHEWCMDSFNDITTCSDLNDGETKTTLNLTQILDKELEAQTEEELTRMIQEKRRDILNLENMLEKKNYFTTQRQLEEYKKIEKNQVYNLIGMVFLLFIAIMLGIVLIYYFLVFRRK
jgi:flagellar biosynthesis/type III secretory pathway M-ring protein FliF/YscJ